MMVRVLLACCIAAGLLVSSQSAALGQAPEDWTVKIGQFDASSYPEITLFINVTDSSGNNVGGLAQEDFEVTEDGEPVDIVEFAGLGNAGSVDIVYVFDTTGSMGEEIAGVIHTSQAFADKLESKGRDYRLGLVTFSDKVLQVYRQDDTLTDAAEEFKGWVGELVADGGFNDQENDYGALKRAAQMQFREDVQKIFILITDAPMHVYGDEADGGQSFDDPDLDGERIRDILTKQGIAVYAVAPAYQEFTSLAEGTGGRFYNINENPDFTGIIEEIGETIANQYRITYRSPRPTYDGTRRDVRIKVGEADAATEYHEKHLLNIQSNCLVGALCLAPLLVMLAAPLAGQALLRRKKLAPGPAVPQATGIEAIPAEQMVVEKTGASQPAVNGAGFVPSPPIVSDGITCANCNRILKPAARFCPACGTQVAQPDSVKTAAAPSSINCPNCNQVLRPGAKFCNSCGSKL